MIGNFLKNLRSCKRVKKGAQGDPCSEKKGKRRP